MFPVFMGQSEDKICIKSHLTSRPIHPPTQWSRETEREHKNEWVLVIRIWFTTHIKTGIYYISNSIWGEGSVSIFPVISSDGKRLGWMWVPSLSDSPVVWATTHTEANTCFWLDTVGGILNLILVNIWEIRCPAAFTVQWNNCMKCRRELFLIWQSNTLHFRFSNNTAVMTPFKLLFRLRAWVCRDLTDIISCT